MKKIFLTVISFSLVLGACNQFGSSKIKQLIDFTPSLITEKSAEHIKVVLDPASTTKEWPDHINSTNIQPRNISYGTDISRFQTLKLGKNNISTPPIIASSMIFTLDNNDNVSAFDENSFKQLWSTNISPFGRKKEFSGGGLVHQSGKLAVVGGSRDLVILNAKTGKEIFKKTLTDIIKTQAIFDGNKVIVVTVSNVLYCIDINSGTTLWQHEAMPEILASGRFIAPILHKDKVIVAYSSGIVYLINAKTGQQEWGVNLAAESNEMPGFAAVNVEVQPIIENNNVYIASNSGYIFKIRFENGEVMWKKPIQDIKSMILSGNMLYLVTNGKQVAALTKEDGLVKWTLSLRDEKEKKAQPVAFSNQLIINNILCFTTSDGYLFKIDPINGQFVEKIAIAKGALSQAVSNNNYFIFTSSAKVLKDIPK